MAPGPYYVWPEPVEGGHASASRTNAILKRFIFVVLALNVLVLAGLVVFQLSAGDGATAAASLDDSTTSDDAVVPDEPAPTAAPSTEAGDEEAGTADVITADQPEVATPTPADDGADVSDDQTAETVGDAPTTIGYPPPFPDPYEPTANEVQAAAKELGSLVAYVITNYEADATLDDVLATLPPVDPEFANQVVLETQVVHHPGMWSRGTVEYAQLGGHLDGRISIIVVIRQTIGADGDGEPERTETRTMEVRLAQGESGVWQLETIASTGGQPVERPDDLSAVAAAVVDHELIDLPDSAVWDIYSGHTDDVLLQTMLDMAERASYSVVVLHTGHAHNVFGTGRVSNHTVGRAVDIYMVNGERVIDSHDTSSSVYALSEWIVSRTDIKEFGSPWRFDDPVAHTFTNHVHHDHIHVGVFPYAPPAPADES